MSIPKKLIKKTVFKKILDDGRIYSIYPKTSTDIVYYNESERLTTIIDDLYSKITGDDKYSDKNRPIKYIAISDDNRTVKFYCSSDIDEDSIPDYTYTIPDVIVKKQSYLEFPPIGDNNCMYIDTTTGSTYIWDDINMNYLCTGRDYEKIKIIYGGNSNTE